MDKLKDFIYEISDLIFGGAVLLIIILISTYQLHGWFNISLPENIEKIIPISTGNDLNSTETNTEIAQNNSSSEDTNKVPEASNDATNENEAPKEDNTNNTSSDTQTENKSAQAEVTIRNISIAPGSSSDKVANALYENNIISSKENFISRLIELNAETKIKAGTFRIPSNASLDEVIKIVTQ